MRIFFKYKAMKFRSLYVVAAVAALFATPGLADTERVLSGTVDIDQTRVAFLVSGNGGGGTLHFKGKDYPFTIENARIAELSSRRDYGSGVLVPHPEPFILPATFQGRPLTFPVDPAFTGEPENVQISSPMVLPDLTGRPRGLVARW